MRYINPGSQGSAGSVTVAAEQKLTITLGRTIVLIGLMGAGKTSVGKRLAAMLGVPFSDSDAEIVAAAGMEIPEIFERYGEAEFRDGEQKVIARLLTQTPRVLATGGGAFMNATIRQAISDSALSVWLNADLETLWDRVRDRPTRPLLQVPDPKGTLAALLETRGPVYALADVVVPSEAGQSHEEMVERILRAIRAHDLAHPDAHPVLVPEVAS